MPTLAARTRLLSYLRRHGRTAPLKLASETGLSRDAVHTLLDDLMDCGEVYYGDGGYELASVRIDVPHEDPSAQAAVLTHLRGRKDTAAGVARATGLTPVAALSACEHLLARGQLRARSVGSLRLYLCAPITTD
ncbi:winged helix-turn-helix transcriptional regulator [Deinococcus pimensis]|uniref:winged helix-turn-helix transcriptional regulator n=1 Tax=Deinococcus pimensis TaxID=309888 RepID=UPI00048287ED|nr:winged helix-turn-helix transcriptional regulator [Deinococcus pimensis]